MDEARVGAIQVQTHVNLHFASDSKLVGFKRSPRRRGGGRLLQEEPRAPEICKESLSGI